MKYDDASWHYGGEFPAGLPIENGGTHIGMFLGWVITRDLVGELHLEESAPRVQEVKDRRITGRDFLFFECDGKLIDEDLNATGNSFAMAYYESTYSADYYDNAFPEGEDPYSVEDSWANFDRLAEILDRRFSEWQQGAVFEKEQPPKRRCWQFWS